MNLDIVLLLAQDGLTNGAIYALLALALVMVFAVTRVIFVPQGEFVAFGALTLASFQGNKLPGTLWLLLLAGSICFLMDWRYQQGLGKGMARRLRWSLMWQVLFPLGLALLVFFFTIVAIGPGKATLMGANHSRLTGSGTTWTYDLSARLSAHGSGADPRASYCFSSGPFSACGNRACLFWR